ncbi:brain protein I3-like [Mya arenaria]|uniref:brain protein I3-like n=1 Tax=Mya arenaria TaxID=6604 RepID=UPI0022E6872C|nr:brain protein I3-like [Mya arenaria]
MQTYPPPPPSAYPPPGQNYPPPGQAYNYPQGYGQPQPAYGSHPNSTVIVTQAGVVGIGNCPHCRRGFIRDQYSPIGLVLAICFFPLGIICCVLMAEKRCNSCGVRC